MGKSLRSVPRIPGRCLAIVPCITIAALLTIAPGVGLAGSDRSSGASKPFDRATPKQITIGSMSAMQIPGGVLVRWVTIMEIDTAAFRVLRASGVAGNEKSVGTKHDPLPVSDWIPAAGSPLTGAKYEWLDRMLRLNLDVLYYIEEADAFGRVTRYGPIVPQPMRTRP